MLPFRGLCTPADRTSATNANRFLLEDDAEMDLLVFLPASIKLCKPVLKNKNQKKVIIIKYKIV